METAGYQTQGIQEDKCIDGDMTRALGVYSGEY